MVCPACESEVLEGAKFCTECGSPLAAACPSCGAPHAPGQKFCAECGTALAGSRRRPRPTPPAAASRDCGARPRAEAGVGPVRRPGRASPRCRRSGTPRRCGNCSRATSRPRARSSAATRACVEKFIGDAVMAVWGAPVAREDDAERAVRAGLEMVDAVAAFGEEVGRPELRARAGVATGQVASLPNPGEGLVVGDRVNTAARTQSCAQPGTVYVDEVTQEVTSAAIEYEDTGEHAAKGKAEPLHLWHAVRVVAGVGGSERETRIRGAARRPRHRPQAAQGALPRRARAAVGAARRRVRDRGGRQDSAASGVRQVRRRPRGPGPVALGTLPVIRRGRRLLGAGRDGPPAAWA